MSSLDRAFFRAYAKEQPPAAETQQAAEEAPAGVSPYVHFQGRRRPQLRYRIDQAHAPWGQAASPAPVVDVTPQVEAPGIAAEPDAISESVEAHLSAWSSGGLAKIAEPSAAFEAEAPKVKPIASAAAHATPKAYLPAVAEKPQEPEPAQADPFAEAIVCLPGVAPPVSDYLANFVPEPEPELVPPVAVAAVAAPAIELPPAAVHEPLVSPPPVIEQPVESAPPEVEEPLPTPVAEAVPATEATVSTTELLADDTAAMWEVEHYLYPEVSDRLLNEYSYFAQAGRKMKQAAAAGLKMLAITGVVRHEGRTTLAITLARSAAAAGMRVVLVDCDFDHPELAQRLGLDIASGWQDVAAGEVALAEVAIRSLDDGITLLPLTSSGQTARLSLDDPSVRSLLDQCRSRFDLVILDHGPQLQLTRATNEKPIVDAAIVVWDRRTQALDAAQEVARSLQAAGVEAIGIAENFSE
jgi:Mrp family chromosome partitioning ATPase